MDQSVQDTFLRFSSRFEGNVNFMYLDTKGFVTVGIGNLIDPIAAALVLPFVHKSDGSPAIQDEIHDEWNTLKGRPELARQGYKACEPLTKLMLTDEAIIQLVLTKLNQNATTLKSTKEFTGLDAWPADAQLGILSMAWAMGPAFGSSWPIFRAACGAGDWTAAANNCRMQEVGNPGLKPRNDADVLLFTNAAVVAANGLELSTLYWPNAAQAPTSATGPVITALEPTSGASGDEITIWGSGFTNVTDVSFGTISTAAATVVSDTQLTVTVPNGTGMVDVAVVTSVGQSPSTSNDQFTYTTV